MKARSWLFSAGLALSAFSAWAQTNAPENPSSNAHAPAPGNPAGTPPETRESAPGVPAPGQLNQADRTFILAATHGGNAEVELGTIAEQKGGSDGVKEFGRAMIQDHTSANKRLAALVQKAMVQPQGGIDTEHKILRDRLNDLSGAAFDREYINAQIIDHQATAQLLEYEIGSGQDANLKAYASALLPIVFHHLQSARSLSDDLAKRAATSK